jgi:hypothetical protein
VKKKDRKRCRMPRVILSCRANDDKDLFKSTNYRHTLRIFSRAAKPWVLSALSEVPKVSGINSAGALLSSSRLSESMDGNGSLRC